MYRYKKTLVEKFSKGMNNTDKAETLKDQCVWAENIFTGDERISKGPGTTLAAALGYSYDSDTEILTTTIAGPTIGSGSDGTYMYYVANNKTLYRWDGATTNTSLKANAVTVLDSVEFISNDDYTYLFNGTDVVNRIDGVTITTLAGIPKGKYAIIVNSRLYVSGVDAYPNRVYYSNLSDYETFGGSDYFDVNPDSDDDITGLSTLSGNLIIGKRKSIFAFNGFTVDDFTVKNLTSQLPDYGVASHKSFVNIGNDLLFLNFSGGTVNIMSLKRTQYDALNYSGVISHDIEEFLNDINLSKLPQVSGGFDGRYVYWAVPYKTSTTNNYVIMYDTVKKGFSIHSNFYVERFIRSSLSGVDRLYISSSDALLRFDYINLDVTTRAVRSTGESGDIKIVYRSKIFESTSQNKSKWKYIYITPDNNSTTDIDVYASIDGGVFEYQGNIEIVGSDTFPYTFPITLNPAPIKKKRISFKTKQSYTVQIEFREESTQVVTLNNFTILSQTKNYRNTN